MARIDVPRGPGGDAVQIWSLRPDLSGAMQNLVQAAYHSSILPVGVREAARMAIAEQNQCAVCRNFRADSIKEEGLTEEFYRHVGDHGKRSDYSSKERLAIEFAERFAVDHSGIDDQFVDTLREHFTDPEVLDLTICCAAFLGLGRMLTVLGVQETSLRDV